jgi:hypothetical protein
MDIVKGVKPSDYALTAVMVALAVLIGVENVTVSAPADMPHALDSQSPWMIPVFAAAALPILWRRRHILPAIAVSFAVVAASLPMFGWVTRCGFALPLALAMAYAVARFAGNRQNQVVGLVGVLALQVVTLVHDASTGGLGALAISVPATAICYGIGLAVQRRSEKQAEAPTLTVESVNA